MPADKDEDLKSFQIGLRSGAAPATPKKTPFERLEITKEDYPNLTAVNRSKSTFKKKTNEKLESFKQVLTSDGESSEEKERAEKAKRAWERALEVVSHLSLKD